MSRAAQFWTALALLLIAPIFWLAGAWIGFSGDRVPGWLYSCGEWMFLSSPFIGGAALVWLAWVVIFSFRR
jgi:hypothetical protein